MRHGSMPRSLKTDAGRLARMLLSRPFPALREGGEQAAE
jgi:hypothetical protein